MILDLLRGFAFGLFLSCPAWFLVGMMEPRNALEEAPYTRTRVILRTWFILPFIAVIAGLTSLWGDGASLAGWLLGLSGYAAWLVAHKRLRAFRANRARRRRDRDAARALAALRARMEAEQAKDSGSGSRVLPQARPAEGDGVVTALWEVKQRLTARALPEAARQADRLYGRYRHALDLLGERFDAGEVTHARYRGLLAQVCYTAADTLGGMEGVKASVAAIDVDYLRRRLAEPGLGAEERRALEARQTLVEEADRRLRGLAGGTEEAITALDHAAVTLGALRTRRGKASVDAETAVRDLQTYLDQAHRFDARPAEELSR
jgi:hypothetical protein